VTRRWIIRKDDACAAYGCEGHGDRKKVRTSVDPKTGFINIVCKVCKRTSVRQSTTFKSRRPCKGCKSFRDVTVSLWSQGPDKPMTEHFNEYCLACTLEMSATKHQRTANEFFARALILRNRRKRREAAEAAADGKET